MITAVNLNYEFYDVRVARPSIWGNPYTHLPYGKGQFKVKTREEAVYMFALYWYADAQKYLRRESLRLPSNSKLGCVCGPLACHAHVIAGYINWKLKEAFFDPITYPEPCLLEEK
jgi:hypothetical protein